MTAATELELVTVPAAEPASTVLPALRELRLDEIAGAKFDISRAIARLREARRGLADIDAALAAAPQGDTTP